MQKTYRYRLYPSEAQAKLLDATLETCRRWYNTCLAERRDAWQERRETLSTFAQLRSVKDLKRDNPFATGIHSHVLQLVVQDLGKAFDAFFRRVKAGQAPGYPRFKGRNRFDSFGFKQLGNGFKIDESRLSLSGIGRIAVRWHRPLGGPVKTARITRRAGKWFACFSCVVGPQPLPATGEDIGIDVGITSLITTSTGDKVRGPKHYRRAQKKLRVLQRLVARRTKGSANRRKAVLALQRQHEHIKNQRKDFIDKLVDGLILAYDRIALEDLRIRNMVRNHHLAKGILDSGWGYLAQRLATKAEEAGRIVCQVDPAYTSRTCSACGVIIEGLTLATRWVDCACGLSLDRDHNAAINILNRAGRARWGLT